MASSKPIPSWRFNAILNLVVLVTAYKISDGVMQRAEARERERTKASMENGVGIELNEGKEAVVHWNRAKGHVTRSTLPDNGGEALNFSVEPLNGPSSSPFRFSMVVPPQSWCQTKSQTQSVPVNPHLKDLAHETFIQQSPPPLAAAGFWSSVWNWRPAPGVSAPPGKRISFQEASEHDLD